MEIVLFFLALVLVTVVGHGIWVAIAALVRAVANSGTPPAPKPHALPCPACDVPVSPNERYCPSCELDQTGARADRLREIEAARRAVNDMASAGELDRETANNLRVLLTRRRGRILGGQPRPEPAREEAPPEVVRVPPRPIAPPPARVEILDAIEVLEEAQPVPAPPPPPAPRVSPAPVFAAPVAAREVEPPAPPRKPLTDVLGGFMAARNILWGELVGGLLIVGCSIALVLTLWNSLQALPYFPFLVFSGITAALFGAGLYTLHHWKLAATSQGLLVIAALLAPLNLLVLADPTARGNVPALGWVHPLVALLSLLFFGWMLWSAGRDLIGANQLPGPLDRRWLLALAVVGTAGTQLLTPAFYPAFDDAVPFGTLLALAFIPGACYLLTTGAVIGGLAWYGRKPLTPQPPLPQGGEGEPESKKCELSVSQAHALFSFLGLAVFSLIVSLAFLESRDVRWTATLPAVALPLALAGAPGLAAGLLVRRRLGSEDAGTRTAGTAVTLAGLGLMLAGLAVAWPQPWPLLVVAVVNAVALGLAAYRGRSSFLHVGSLACLALAVLVGVQLAQTGGEVPAAVSSAWLLRGLASISSSVAVALLVAGIAALAIVLDRRGQRGHAGVHAVVGFALGVFALFVATAHGTSHPWLAAIVHGLLALTALASCVHAPRHTLAQVGAWLLLPASLWTLQAALPGERFVWGAIVGGEGLLLLLAAGALRSRVHPVRVALQAAGAATGVLALALAFPEHLFRLEATNALVFAVVAAQALILAAQTRQAGLTFVGSAFALLSLLALSWQIPAGRLPLPSAVALLVHASLALVAARLLRSFKVGEQTFALPLELTASLTSLLSVPFVLQPGDFVLWRAGYALWASGLWMALAWRWQSPGWFVAVRAGVATSLLLATRALIDAQGWFGEPGVIDPRVLQTYSLALALLGLVGVGLRRVKRLEPLLPSAALFPDRVATSALIFGNFVVLSLHAFPGMVAEWSPNLALDGVAWWVPGTFGLPGWLSVAALIVLLLAALRQPPQEGEEPFRLASLAGLFVLVGCAVLLWAGGFCEERATASALRWGLAMLFVGGSVLTWCRERFARLALQTGFAFSGDNLTIAGRIDLVIRPLASLAGLAVFLLSAIAACLTLAGLKRGGPVAESIFAQMGSLPANVGPLVLLAIGLVGSAFRERSSVYAFLACQLVSLTAVTGYALSLPGFTTSDGLFLWLLAVQTASAGALCWLAAGRRLPDGVLLTAQAWLGLPPLLLLGLAPLAWWMFRPDSPLPDEHQLLGRWPGWLALALAFAASFLHARRHAPTSQAGALTLTVLLTGVFAGCLAAPWDGAGEWLAYHVLTLTWCALALILVGVGFSTRWAKWPWPAGFSANAVSAWLSVLAAALCLVALRGRGAPWQPWLPAAAALTAALVFAAPALWFRRATFSYPSGLAIVLAGWITYATLGGDSAAAFWLTLSLSLALASAVWSLPDVRDSVPFSLLAAPLAVALAAGTVWLTVAGQVTTFPLILGAVTLLGVGIALFLERPTRIAAPGGYVLLLAVAGFGLIVLGPNFWGRPSMAGLALALHVSVAAGIAWRFRSRSEREWGWLFPTQFAAMAVVATLAIWTCLAPLDLSERLAGPLMLLLLVPAAWLLTEAAPTFARLRLAGLAPFALAAAVASLALAVPQADAFLDLRADKPVRFLQILWLERSAWLLLAVAVTAIVYLEWPSRSSTEQTTAWQRLCASAGSVGRTLFPIALILSLVVIGEMMPLFDPLTRRTPMSGPAVIAVFVALSALLVTVLRMALVAGRDPLNLSELGRQLYVYLAEVLFVLVFVNARLNVPELFRGALAQYWTIIVMTIAFVGVGTSELFGRRGLHVLSRPLQRTAMFLPLIPLLAFWARPSVKLVDVARDQAPGMVPFLENLTKLPWNFEAHALIWFLAGGLYFVLALTRQSTRWALVAALAANFGLWALWASQGVHFLSHPQVWLIPLGLIALTSEHVERRNLSPGASAALRYLGICVIYVASTAELFITGLGTSLWLPVILAVLCVLGVLAGIWLRVKAFLFLGVSFLLLDLGTMIWHAAVNREHTWVWWASGIVLGVAILALFALFEKRRNDVLQVLEDLKTWS